MGRSDSDRHYEQQRTSQSTGLDRRHRLRSVIGRHASFGGRLLDSLLETTKGATGQENTATRAVSAAKNAATGKHVRVSFYRPFSAIV